MPASGKRVAANNRGRSRSGRAMRSCVPPSRSSRAIRAAAGIWGAGACCPWRGGYPGARLRIAGFPRQLCEMSARRAAGSFRVWRVLKRKPDAERRPVSAGVERQRSAVALLDDALGGVEAEPGAAAALLGGEERLEHVLAHLGR